MGKRTYVRSGGSWVDITTGASFPASSTPPTSPIQGQIYFDTDDLKAYIYDGTSWVTLGEVTLTGTQTLSNKTLTAPKFASAGEIDDANGNELIKFPATVASAVNEVTISNAATGANPTISATGGDTDISINLVPKGSGTIQANGTQVVTTSGAQTLTGKTISAPIVDGGDTTTATDTASLNLIGYNQRGGSGYHGVIDMKNTFVSATNPKKFFRLNSTGGLEIVNNAYSAVIFSVADSGAVMTGSTLTINGDATLNGQSDLRFADSDSSNWVAFQAPATIASNVTWTLPSTDGSANQVLQTNGSGTLSWATPSAGGGAGSVTVTAATASFTLGTAAVGVLYYCSTNNVTITVPSDATASIPTGSLVYIVRAGAQTVDVAAGASATLQRTYGVNLRAQWSAATLLKSAANTWVLIGDTA